MTITDDYDFGTTSVLDIVDRDTADEIESIVNSDSI